MDQHFVLHAVQILNDKELMYTLTPLYNMYRNANLKIGCFSKCVFLYSTND
jgi:hypothetical protein